jgi:hypothetical protein
MLCRVAGERQCCDDDPVSESAEVGPSGSWFGDARVTVLAPQESWISPKTEVRESAAHGRGTFAVAAIAAGETVQVWGQLWQGELAVEYTASAVRAAAAASRGLVVMQWDDDLFSIERRGGDPGYFINHSCDSGLWFADAFTLLARRPAAPGDELTLDYALFEGDQSFRADWACRCGAGSCRGVVTGRDWMRSDLQDWYAGRFTPLLNKRIAATRSPDRHGEAAGPHLPAP